MTEHNAFATELLKWFDKHGRHDLPWQQPRSYYRVWLSEIMLQQTQVVTVIPYFEKFIKTFPNIASLAAADEQQVMGLWAGLGYYARARNLHKAAKIIVQNYAGEFPQQIEHIEALPGIGKSTAAAIAAQAGNQRYAILDGNVKRVLSRYFQVPGWPGKTKVADKLWQYSDQLTPEIRPADYTQAIMDFGATLCTRSKPKCGECPVANNCHAKKNNCVDQYPQSKPKKVKPHKTRYMPIIVNSNDELLLEKRPTSGIWGGLMSLPEYAEKADLLACLASEYKAENVKIAAEHKHEFSHYSLSIYPVVVKSCEKTASVFTIADQDNYQWHPVKKLLADIENQPLPAPIQKILMRELK